MVFFPWLFVPLYGALKNHNKINNDSRFQLSRLPLSALLSPLLPACLGLGRTAPAAPEIGAAAGKRQDPPPPPLRPQQQLVAVAVV